MGISFILSFYFLFVLVLAIYSILFFVFRTKVIPLFTDELVERKNILSPVSGKIMNVVSGLDHPLIGQNVTAIQFMVNFLDQYGVYLPADAEIENITLDEYREVNRYKVFQLESEKLDLKKFLKNGLNITLKTKEDKFIGLQLLKGKLSARPKILIAPGDRGKARANVGVVPLGGIIVMYLDESYKVFSKIGEEVNAGLSILATQADIIGDIKEVQDSRSKIAEVQSTESL